MLLRSRTTAGSATAALHSSTCTPVRLPSVTRCSTDKCKVSSSSSSSSSSSGSSEELHAAGCTSLQPAAVQQQLPPSFWDERRAVYHAMRHERDRSNRRKRLQQLKAVEEAQLAGLPQAARSAYEAETTALRIAAAGQQQAALAHALQHGLKVVIDCSYCMHEHGSSSSSSSSSSKGLSGRARTAWQRAAADSSHEVRSLAKQIELCVSLNRRSSQPVALTVTSFTAHLETIAQRMGALSWPINKHTEHVLQLLPPEQLVVLSPDADEPLLQLSPDKAYVVGGIVDRSVCKGLTAGFGARHGLRTVRLPVVEYAPQLGLGYADANTRPILNVSDVVVALMEFNRTGDWVHALEQALPARKRRGPANLQQQQRQKQAMAAL